ncbi:protein adenylyltransferase SelO [Spongiibacter pelagi]|uniref:protein adenylyltransferase SelO n=1 Tax=Spongiibacter pelagi TaxID=2760804 RepID=UPI00295A9D7C|nr:YdiU family protein [Spongiibacter pelagi]
MFKFDNSYAQLGENFSHSQTAMPVPAPKMIRFNSTLAQQLGASADALSDSEWAQILAGNQVPTGANPIATVYAGHQFGNWNPQLGDGRALLIGEILTPQGERFDLQLKGSGPTPFSRSGDGKSPLGPVLREYILSEAMARLGVPTTRALAAVSTGESVYRERGPLPGAILTRIASSHLRVGTVQYFYSQQDLAALKTLVDYILQRHFPEQQHADSPALALLEQVIAKQAELIARWQGIGFIHGVMNTDNMLLCGETIDYGPCAFMDTYHPGTVFSSIDHNGRYAFGNQPAIANWNLVQLAQALLPLIDEDENRGAELAQAAINQFPHAFFKAYHRVMANKLGIENFSSDDEALYTDFLNLLEVENADFTLAFRKLADLADENRTLEKNAPEKIGELFQFSEAFTPWLTNWRQRLANETQSAQDRQQQMYLANPVFIPRNHLVEEAINQAYQHNDLSFFQQLVDVLEQPFTYKSALRRYALPPREEERVERTFCGT